MTKQTENICTCGHKYTEHIVDGIYEPDVSCGWYSRDENGKMTDCHCKKFTPQKQDAHSQDKSKLSTKSSSESRVLEGVKTPDARKGNAPQTKPKYPKTAKDCEDIFMSDDGEFELTCGKRSVYGDWALCPKCRKLKENKDFIK